MKKIADLDERMLDMGAKNDKPEDMPTRREILRLFGNHKANSADDARRTRRIITKIRDKSANDLILENEDIAFLTRTYEANVMGLPAWMQGQILDVLDAAETVQPQKVS
jgi:hypothetical protein